MFLVQTELAHKADYENGAKSVYYMTCHLTTQSHGFFVLYVDNGACSDIFMVTTQPDNASENKNGASNVHRSMKGIAPKHQTSRAGAEVLGVCTCGQPKSKGIAQTR